MFPGWKSALCLSSFGITGRGHANHWQDWLFSDTAYLHAIIAVSSSVKDFLMQRQPSKTTSHHLKRSITHLNKTLSITGTISQLSDTTVAVVMSLCIASFLSLDESALNAHRFGLQEMIRLRGGIKTFSNSPQFIWILTRWVHSFAYIRIETYISLALICAYL